MNIEKYLLKIGIQPHLKGFYFLAEAIDLVIKNHSYLKNVTKKLYVEIANNNDESIKSVIRAMTHAIRSTHSNLSITKFISKHAIEIQSIKK